MSRAVSRAPRWQVLAGLGVLLALAISLAIGSALARLDGSLVDSQQRLLARLAPRTAVHDVVVVGIDDGTLAAFPEPLALWHAHLGRFLEAMALAQPAAVGMDIVLPERSFDNVLPGQDKLLLRGLLAHRGSNRLVLALTVDAGGHPRAIHAPFLSVAGRDALGHVLLPVDADGVVRRAPGAVGNVPGLAAAMAARMGVATQQGLVDQVLAPPRRYLPLQQVLAWMEAGDTAQLRTEFGGKPVLLGTVLPFEDRWRQPVNLAPWETDNGLQVPGVVIHAQLLASMLNGGLIKPAPTALVALLAACTAFLWFARGGLGRVTLLAAAAVLVLYGASTLLLSAGTHLPIAAAMLVAVLALSGRWLLEALHQLAERARLRRAFAGYVSPAVMDEIVQGGLTDALGGDVRKVCVMFADVRGFTTFSETMAPAALIALLNRYFELVMAAIHAQGGTINSIMGDGLMALFGAPKPMDDACERAFAAARGMLDALAVLNAQLRAEGRSDLSIGIGLHYGEAVVGHVGSAQRHDYSAIGDTINLASRIEGITRAIGYPVACTREVVQALPPGAGFASAGLQAIKGRSAVEVFGWQPPPPPHCGSSPTFFTSAA